jgi:hypothetical protein
MNMQNVVRLAQRQATSFRVAREGFERAYLLELLERHHMDLEAAAREAELPVEELEALVRKHVRPYFIERVRRFYGEKLGGGEAGRIADHLLSLELAQSAG